MPETVERGRLMRRDVKCQSPSRARMNRSQETLFSIAGFIGLKTLPHVTISLTISLTMPVFSIVDDGIQR